MSRTYIPGQYDYRLFDNSQSAGRMSDLLRYKAQAAAQGQRQLGDISARTAQGIGQTVAGSLASLAQYQADKPRREAQDLALTEQKRSLGEAERFRGVERFASESGLDATKRSQFYEQAGFRDQGQKVLADDMSKQKQQFDLTSAKMKEHRELLGKAANILRNVQQAPEEARASFYSSALPEISRLVGDDLAKQLPPQYDPQAVQQAIAFGEEADDTLRWSELAARSASLAHSKEVDERERNKFALDFGISALRAAKNGQDWEVAWKFIDKHASDDVKAMFSREYSPEAVDHVRALADQIEGNKTTTPLAGAVDTWSREHNGKRPSYKEFMKIVNEVEDATTRWNPNTGSTGKLTQGQVNTEINRRDRALATVDRQVRSGDMSLEEADAQRQDIHDSFAEATGTVAEPHLTVERGEGGTGPDPNRPPPPDTAIATAPPTGRPPVAPAQAPAPTAAVPANVTRALSKLAPGRYVGKDGSVFIKNADGTITPGR